MREPNGMSELPLLLCRTQPAPPVASPRRRAPQPGHGSLQTQGEKQGAIRKEKSRGGFSKCCLMGWHKAGELRLGRGEVPKRQGFGATSPSKRVGEAGWEAPSVAVKGRVLQRAHPTVLSSRGVGEGLSAPRARIMRWGGVPRYSPPRAPMAALPALLPPAHLGCQSNKPGGVWGVASIGLQPCY